MADKFYVYRPLLDLIGFTEGTAPPKGRGYNETLAYGKMLDGIVTKGRGPIVSLVDLTLQQIDQLQTKMLADPDNGVLKSSAAGMYQIVRTTRRAIQMALPSVYPPHRKFDAACQDEMGCYLLGVRGIDKYLSGRLSEDSLINNLAQEWASFPTTAGKGYYAGQHTPITTQRVRDTLAEVRRRHSEGQPAKLVEVSVPVVPAQVEKEVRQKTNWLTSIFGAGGIAGTFFGWVAGIDHVTLLIVLAAVVVGGIAFLGLGEWIIRRIRSIKQALEE